MRSAGGLAFSSPAHTVLMPAGYGEGMGHLERAHHLSTYRLDTTDGVAGRVHDLYFDDRRWLVRYLVVDVHHALSSRRVLISPVCVRSTDAGSRRFTVSLTREQIRRSPGVDADRPVSRQHEVMLHEYYRLPFYWKDEHPLDTRTADPHLRSMRAIRGYAVIGRDAAVGHVDDFLVDCGAWTVSDVLIARRQWLAGTRRCLPVSAIGRVSWVGKAVYLDTAAVGQTA